MNYKILLKRFDFLSIKNMSDQNCRNAVDSLYNNWMRVHHFVSIISAFTHGFTLFLGQFFHLKNNEPALQNRFLV